MPLQLTVELGRISMPIQDIIALTTGSIIDLSKSVDEPVNIHVHNRLIAQGDVVMVDENYGVRITHVLSHERKVSSKD